MEKVSHETSSQLRISSQGSWNIVGVLKFLSLQLNFLDFFFKFSYLEPKIY